MHGDYRTPNIELALSELRKIWQAHLGDTIYLQILFMGLPETVKLTITRLDTLTIREITTSRRIELEEELCNYFNEFGIKVDFQLYS